MGISVITSAFVQVLQAFFRIEMFLTKNDGLRLGVVSTNGKQLPTAVHYMPGATIFGCLGVWHVSISPFFSF